MYCQKIKDTAFLNPTWTKNCGTVCYTKKPLTKFGIIANIENRILPQTTEEWVSILEDVQLRLFYLVACKKIVDRDICWLYLMLKLNYLLKRVTLSVKDRR
jgi:hypothetical protein